MNCGYKRLPKECVKQVYEDKSSPYYQKPDEWCIGCKKIVDTSSNSDYAKCADDIMKLFDVDYPDKSVIELTLKKHFA